MKSVQHIFRVIMTFIACSLTVFYFLFNILCNFRGGHGEEIAIITIHFITQIFRGSIASLDPGSLLIIPEHLPHECPVTYILACFHVNNFRPTELYIVLSFDKKKAAGGGISVLCSIMLPSVSCLLISPTLSHIQLSLMRLMFLSAATLQRCVFKSLLSHRLNILRGVSFGSRACPCIKLHYSHDVIYISFAVW